MRARARLKELATRLALGAGRWQRGAAARHRERPADAGRRRRRPRCWATPALRLLGTLDLQDLPHGEEIRLDGVAAAYTLALAAAIGVRARAAAGRDRAAGQPHGRAARGRPERHRRAAARARCAARWSWRRSAFTFVLLVGAGLLFASFRQVLAVDPGFDAERVLTASVTLPRIALRRRRQAARASPTRRCAALRALPGVAAAGATDTIPFGGNNSDSVILAEGYQMKPGESVISPSRVDVTPGYFEAMGVRLVRGRFFEERDAARGPAGRSSSTRSWRSASGRTRIRSAGACTSRTDLNNLLAVTDKTVFLTVVGVIEDVKLHDADRRRAGGGRLLLPDGAEHVERA